MDHGRIIAKGTKDELKTLVAVNEKVKIDLSTVNFTLIENLKKIQGVMECSIDGNSLTVISKKQSKNLGKIIDCVSDADSEIISLNVEKPTLESVFLTLTGRKLRD